MSSFENLTSSAIAAVADHRHVDVLGARLSGRTTFLAHITDHFRRDGWEVFASPGRTSRALPSSFEAKDALIAVDDWDHMEEAARALVTKSGATIITTRTGGEPAVEGMHHLIIPRLDTDALRVRLTRVLGVVIEKEDARTLAELSDGVVGVAAGVAKSALERGQLAVVGGRGILAGSWLDAAAGAVATLLGPLSAVEQNVLATVARGQRVGAPDRGLLAKLVWLGYLARGAQGAVTVRSTLLTRWFTRD